MSMRVEFIRNIRSIRRGIRYHRLTYSGWLRYVKRIDVPWDQPKEEDEKLRVEYEEWDAQSETIFSSTYNYVRTSRERWDKITSENCVQELSLEDAVKKFVSYMKRFSIPMSAVCNFKNQVALDLSDEFLFINSEAYIERDDTRRLSEDEYTEALVRIKDRLRKTPEGMTYRKRKGHRKYNELFREMVYKYMANSEFTDATLQATFFGRVVCPRCHRRMEKVYNEDLKRMEWLCNTAEFRTGNEWTGENIYTCGFHSIPIIIVDYETFVEMLKNDV